MTRHRTIGRLAGRITIGIALVVAMIGIAIHTPVLAASADQRSAAMAYLGSGADAYRMGDLVEATRQWNDAARLCRISGDTDLEVEALGRRGEALVALGQLRNAEADLEAALTVAESRGDPAQIAGLTGALGNVALRMHDFSRARRLLDRSLTLARAQGLTGIVAASANNLGNFRVEIGLPHEAVTVYAESIEAARGAGDAPLLATATINLARAQLQDGKPDAALATLDSAAAAAAALPDSVEKAFDFIAIGHAAQPPNVASLRAETRTALAAHAYGALQRGAQLAATFHDKRAQSLASGYLGELYEAAGRNVEATDLARRAIFLAQAGGASDLLSRWEWLNARLARDRGDRAAAIPAYRRAVAALETVRQDIPVDYTEGRSSFRQNAGQLYFQLADQLLQAASSPSTPQMVATAFVLESRNTVETLKTSEIRDYFSDPCLATSTAQRQARLASGMSAEAGSVAAPPKGTAVLYPIILPDRVELVVSMPDGSIQRVSSRVDELTLNLQVAALRKELEFPKIADLESAWPALLPPAAQIYDWVIRPIRAALDAQSIDTIVVVPDGALRSIPFAVLFDGRDYLIHSYAFATVPSLALTDTTRTPVARPRVLLSGLSEAVQGYDPLPGVAQELGAINQIEPGATVLRDERYRLRAIDDALKSIPYSVVHIASHGEFGGDPSSTYILTYDSKLTLNRLEQDIKYSQYRSEPLDLLVLSACSTASNDDRATLGLAGVAVKAGARSAVASLWEINDAAAANLLPAFYQGLSVRHLSKAHALQQAQLKVMSEPGFQHPNRWAPLVLIGNWM